MIDLVRSLLEKYKVDVYICGHDHDRQLLGPVSGVYYIVSETDSKSRNTSYAPPRFSPKPACILCGFVF